MQTTGQNRNFLSVEREGLTELLARGNYAES